MRALVAILLAATNVLPFTAGARAQDEVRTNIVPPPSKIIENDLDSPLVTDTVLPAPNPVVAPSAPAAPSGPASLEIITDLSRLPPPVARMRERIIMAARTGRLDDVVAVMRANEPMPIFALNGDADPAIHWRANFPDSGGIEILATLIDVLETGFVHVDQGTPQEMYLWPYFARVPLKELSPEQKVDLFKLVTGADYKAMLEAGSYNFYRVGIDADGAWRFFVAGD